MLIVNYYKSSNHPRNKINVKWTENTNNDWKCITSICLLMVAIKTAVERSLNTNWRSLLNGAITCRAIFRFSRALVLIIYCALNFQNIVRENQYITRQVTMKEKKHFILIDSKVSAFRIHKRVDNFIVKSNDFAITDSIEIIARSLNLPWSMVLSRHFTPIPKWIVSTVDVDDSLAQTFSLMQCKAYVERLTDFFHTITM